MTGAFLLSCFFNPRISESDLPGILLDAADAADDASLSSDSFVDSVAGGGGGVGKGIVSSSLGSHKIMTSSALGSYKSRFMLAGRLRIPNVRRKPPL